MWRLSHCNEVHISGKGKRNRMGFIALRMGGIRAMTIGYSLGFVNSLNEHVYFAPDEAHAAIVTYGSLCLGLNTSPDAKRTSKDAVESPYIGMIRSKDITQMLLLSALDIIQKRYWRKLRDHVSDIRAVDLILLLRALKLLEKTSAREDRIILLRALRHLENKGKLVIFKGTSASKKERKSNICYTRYLSLIMEHLLGENYINENLKTLKPHHITTSTFKLTLKNEVPLTAHMCNMAKLSLDPIKSLFPPFGEVNADDLADKSLSGTSVQPVTQPKAPTDKRSKKKKNPSSSHLRTFKIIRESSPLTQATDSRHAEEIVVTANPHQRDDTERLIPLDILDQNVDEVKDVGLESLGDVTFEQIIDEYDQKVKDDQEKPESSFVTPPKWVPAEYDVLGALLHRSIAQDMRTTSIRVV
ncbi:hypothetical protein Tco_1136022 [Tanacetum coccineum]